MVSPPFHEEIIPRKREGVRECGRTQSTDYSNNHDSGAASSYSDLSYRED